ncbi:MAG: radical SAM protein [ANME-2 cluster archaeon]|nr:radical SAM protein [ANME-2 cluster archaeon]MBC2706856.1 radical SAM protein [ANME-2 cluster archaeon]MBC2746145.1 radical SAM protein [ANME-2 cluster archaeon]MBC2762169.1 radical SAM protein [ANME-2 cluster archaeon]
MNTMIIDGYVDEPACLGVPPYISPYPRYIAGAMIDQGIPQAHIHYITIDQIRKGQGHDMLNAAGLMVIIAGMTVPGKYLRGTPINLSEISDITRAAAGTPVILGGPIRLGYGSQGGMRASGFELAGLTLAQSDIEAFVYDMLAPVGGLKDPDSVDHRERTTQEIARWGVKGAFMIRQHPDYPNVMCELETYRGCARPEHCSFCTEPFYGEPNFRDIKDVVSEVGALYHHGARYFRIGRQPDLFSYHARDWGGELLVPDPDAIEQLYRGIRNSAPGLKVLHMDNANPGTIAAYPVESEQIARIIVKYHTSGDVAAMGMESADPAVVRANCLKAMPEDVLEAIKLVNRVGDRRGDNGLPELLPGLNIIHGLKGENKETFDHNFRFLKMLLDSGLMVRRINIRQVMAFPGTSMWQDEGTGKYHDLFMRSKDKVRKEIDLPMLERLVPVGTVLKKVMCEVHDGITFGRQMASYPLLVGIPDRLPLGKFIDVTVTGHGHRSITAIPYPLDINSAGAKLISQLPGVGKKRTRNIIRGRPYWDEDDLAEKLGDVEGILPFIKIE